MFIHRQIPCSRACISNAVDNSGSNRNTFCCFIKTYSPHPNPLLQRASFPFLLTFSNWFLVHLSLLSPLYSLRPSCPPWKPVPASLTESLPFLGLGCYWIVGLSWAKFRKPARSQLSHFQQGHWPRGFFPAVFLCLWFPSCQDWVPSQLAQLPSPASHIELVNVYTVPLLLLTTPASCGAWS